jgi:hypothetical protein
MAVDWQLMEPKTTNGYLSIRAAEIFLAQGIDCIVNVGVCFNSRIA